MSAVLATGDPKGLRERLKSQSDALGAKGDCPIRCSDFEFFSHFSRC
jgi:hypothetical protein